MGGWVQWKLVSYWVHRFSVAVRCGGFNPAYRERMNDTALAITLTITITTTMDFSVHLRSGNKNNTILRSRYVTLRLLPTYIFMFLSRSTNGTEKFLILLLLFFKCLFSWLPNFRVVSFRLIVETDERTNKQTIITPTIKIMNEFKPTNK
mmetsp:Transcript_3198/g.6901  ORF Transcript_3198/g.6901 Transcript_3198/m.6901 type:complete len:150 (+) Transcript_3198:77-526(+)